MYQIYCKQKWFRWVKENKPEQNASKRNEECKFHKREGGNGGCKRGVKEYSEISDLKDSYRYLTMWTVENSFGSLFVVSSS